MNRVRHFTFKTAPDFEEGIRRLAPILGFDTVGGIIVTAEEAAASGVSLHNGRAVIRYSAKHQFFRQLGILAEHAEDADFDSVDDSHFTQISVMLDASSGGIPTVECVCRMLDRLVLMGYNMAMLYTEDTIELESYPHFGYMRGRYSADELRAIDDYAWEYGIEMIPCLECYGHMNQYLKWPEAGAIKDTASVLLAREDKTFAFLEALLTKVRSCFRSNRVHIGMDEANDMGRGRFLTKHGYVPPFQIFTEYMKRLIEITDKLGMIPMMWSDMYFRVSSSTGTRYYGENIEIPPEVAEQIPESVELVFWHYGEEPHCDDYMLKKHKALKREVIYAGGSWSWCGHFPEHNYAMEACAFSLDACRKNDVHRAMLTVWLRADGDIFANLFDLSYFAEKCCNPTLTKEQWISRFAAATGGNWEAFYMMGDYHNRFEKEEYPNFNERFFGTALFYQDLMEGIYDKRLWDRPMSDHYTACEKKMSAFHGGEWEYLYDFSVQIFAYLALKTKIHENLVPAYKAGDRETLRAIASEQIPALKELLIQLHTTHRTIWNKSMKPFNWYKMEYIYAGMTSQCDTSRLALEAYLSGQCSSLPQLDEPRPAHPLNGFAKLRV